MTVRVVNVESVGARKLKAHKKSRKGCKNCKVRSVKCDESKPSCKRCVSYGVSCSYSGSPDEGVLQLPSELTSVISFSSPPISLESPISSDSPISFGSPISYFPDIKSELIAKFQNRTALTVTAGGRVRLYQNEILGLARSSVYLMNSILALTRLHDHHLMKDIEAPTPFNSAYYSKALSSFNTAVSHALSRASRSRDRGVSPSQTTSPDLQAAMWTTGAILGTIVFYNIDATCPEQAWPLRPSNPNDLDWLKLNEGKKHIYALTQGLKVDPIYKPLFEVHTNSLLPPASSPPSYDRLPPELLIYFNVFGSPSDDDRLYHSSIRHLARVYDVDCSIIMTILTFWTWNAEMTPEFRQGLEWKEPKALLTLALWWAEIYQTTVWWLSRRARLEGAAICIYLERYHFDDEMLMRVVQYPKAVFRTPLWEARKP